MKKIIIYGIGKDFRVYFGQASLYDSLTKEMGADIIALCDGNADRFGEEIQVGHQTYIIQDICDVPNDSYDSVVVTTNRYFREIQMSLSEKGIDGKKVVSLIDYLHETYFEGTYLYGLSIVLIIQNEASYLREWMEYHRMLGVDHFYIYDNESTDDLREFLTEYIEQDTVTYQYWTDGQSEAYQHAVDHYKFESKYMAIIDVDEFLVPVDSPADELLMGMLDGILDGHRERMKSYGIQKLLGGGVGINWRVYGTSGHKKRPGGLVIENYMHRLGEERIESAHIKTVANPRTVQKCHPHHMDYIAGFACLSEKGSYITDMLFPDGCCEKIRINHYFTRSGEELHYKTCRRGYGYLKDIKASPEEWYTLYLNRLKDYNDSAVIYDAVIARFIAPLRERLKISGRKVQMLNRNQSVVIYGVNLRGAKNFEMLTEQNVHVDAFCDKVADQITLFKGCQVLNLEMAVQRFGQNPFVISMDDEEEKERVVAALEDHGVEYYRNLPAFLQGEKDVEMELVPCGKNMPFRLAKSHLEGVTDPVCFSFGVGFDYTFEKELAEKYGAVVYAFDPTPEVIRYMEDSDVPEKLHYFPYGLSDQDGEKEFHCPNSDQAYTDYSEYFAAWTSEKTITVEMYRLATLMKKFGFGHLDILKMDVEGSEFLALPEILGSGVRFDQLCLETHARMFPDSVDKIRGIKKLLNENGYLMICNGATEQTYIHESLIKE